LHFNANLDSIGAELEPIVDYERYGCERPDYAEEGKISKL
jgi:hypothetical protein